MEHVALVAALEAERDDLTRRVLEAEGAAAEHLALADPAAFVALVDLEPVVEEAVGAGLDAAVEHRLLGRQRVGQQLRRALERAVQLAARLAGRALVVGPGAARRGARGAAAGCKRGRKGRSGLRRRGASGRRRAAVAAAPRRVGSV